MKKIIIGLVLGFFLVEATPIKLSKEQEKDWEIEVKSPTLATQLVIGEYMAEVTTPPQYFVSIALPFDAQIKKLYVAEFDSVKKGELLAEVTGRAWIELQQRFIADAIELKHHGHLAERKNRLCREGIIAKKECTAANAEHQADKIKAAASKALLRGYGATKKMINNLFENFKISKTIPLRASVAGSVFELNIRSGKSTMASDTLLVIQKEGTLWLEIAVPIQKARQLKVNDAFEIVFNKEKFRAKLLLKSPKINPKNQTQKLRFSLPPKQSFLTGLRDMAKISVASNSLRVAKSSLISAKDGEVLFVLTNEGYEPKAVEILGEDKKYYYIKADIGLNDKIATTSLAILKGLMQEGEDE